LGEYKLDAVLDLDEWDRFVDNSPQGTIFSYSYYLNSAVDNWTAYWIKKGNQIKAGLVLVLNKDKTKVIQDDLVIHSGVIFSENREQKKVRARSGCFEITEFIARWLDNSFCSTDLTLSPQFEDMRPFLWHNYHSFSAEKKYKLDLRYTSYIDISSLKDIKNEQESSFFKNMDTLRQRNIREARKCNVNYQLDNNTDLLIEYYQVLLSNQGSIQGYDKLARMKSLLNSMIKEHRAVMVTSLSSENKPIYITVYGIDNKRAYYLFGAPNPNSIDRYKGTISFFDGFVMLANKGVNEVDLEGVNSPNRGKFKLGFAGSITPYYRVYK